MTGAHEPRTPAQREPEPVVTTSMSRTGVDRDTNTKRGPVTPVGRSRPRWVSMAASTASDDRWKRRAKPITGVLELDPLVRCERGAQDRVVMLE